MTNQQKEVYNFARQLAEEQVLMLRSKYEMRPEEIVHLYTGFSEGIMSYDQAVDSVYSFNMQQASERGFIAS